MKNLFDEEESMEKAKERSLEESVSSSESKGRKGKRGEPKPEGGGIAFEEALSNLEKIVTMMEREDVPLEELLKRFEEGIGYIKVCHDFLSEARLRIEKYVENDEGVWKLKDVE